MAKIGRNEPCWCQSGKKYKNCHLGRQNENPMPFGAIRNAVTKASDYSTCMHYNASSSSCGKVISAHTLQRSRVLRAIESDDHHVMTFYPMDFEPNGRLKLHRKGWKRASTFKAFCEKHDGEIFEPLEAHPFTGSLKQVFLIAYRAICWELYQKQRGLLSVDTMSHMLDRGKIQVEQKHIQHELEVRNQGMAYGYSEVLRIKNEMDAELKQREFQGYEVIRFRFTGDVSVVATGAVTPNRTISGEVIQVLHDPKSGIEWLPFGVDVDEGGFSVVFLLRKGEDAVAKYMREIVDLSDSEIESFIPQFFFAHCENTYFSEEWWNQLEKSDRSYLADLMEEVNPYYYIPAYDLNRVFTKWKLVARETL